MRGLLPLAERDEVAADMQAEFAWRVRTFGRGRARRWAWRQALRSLPALLGRGWWRGMTGFEPASSRMHPGGPMFESWIMDARYALRRLLSRPAYAALAVLTLALGTGGTAAVFSITRALLVEPLPMAREAEVGVLWFEYSWTEEEFLSLRPDFPGFTGMAAYRPDDMTLEVPDAPLRLVPGVSASHELFDVLGAPPALGRTFQPGDDVPGAEPVVVLSHALWQDLGGRPDVVGSRLHLGGTARTVVGVMPPSFWFPSPTTELWSATPLSERRRSGVYTLVGRSADGVPAAGRQEAVAALARRLGERFTYPEQWDKTRNPSITPAREYFVGDVRPSLLATLGAVGLILLIACANVAALMLGQLDARSTEFAVRTALGAGRRRLLQQLVCEALLIGLAAAVAGAALAATLFGLLTQSLPLGTLADRATLDWTLVWASLGAALPSALLVALVPGLALWRGGRLRATLGSIRTGGIGGRRRVDGGLVVAQIALAVLLAAGAGLLIRSAANLRAIDPGIDVDGLLLVDAVIPTSLDSPARLDVIDAALADLRALPGVAVAAAAQKVPLRESGDNWGIEVVGRPEIGGTTAFRFVTRDYLDALGLQIRRGEGFGPSHREGSEPVVVINEALADKYFGDTDPIGQVIDTGFETGERIIGVVSNAAEAALTDGPEPARYVLYDHLPITPHVVTFVVRAGSERAALGLVAPVRDTLARAGRRLAVQEITTMRHVFDLAVGPTGQVVTLLSLLAGLALVLGAIGVYGVISQHVTRRARDFGIRLALGERPSRVVGQVVRRGVRLVAIGSAVGVAAALSLTRLLDSLLYGVDAADPVAMAAAVGVLMAAGGLAAFVPARRASLTDPAVVLRQS